jgi:TPR repeat protein
MIRKSLIAIVFLSLFSGIVHADSYRNTEELRKTAEKGDAESQNKLGVVYELGLGVNQDYEEAVKWYRQAAAQGSAKAQYSLGDLYEAGHGVARNKVLAREWFSKACQNGLNCGCNRLRSLNEEEEASRP